MNCEHTARPGEVRTLIVSAPTYDQCVFCDLAQLRADLARVTAERDEAHRATRMMSAAYDKAVDEKHKAERDTAEQIAAWMEQCIDDFPRNLDGRATVREAVEHIRAHAWKVQP